MSQPLRRTSSILSQRQKIRQHLMNHDKEPIFIGEQYQVSSHLLGKGTNSLVFSAIHKPTKTKVAVKRITGLQNMQKHQILRLLREIVLLRQLHHPNIIRLYDVIVTDIDKFNQMYLIEELFPHDIKKLLRSNIHLSQRDIQTITYRILLGLKFLECAKVLHRDIKPENILVDEHFQVKLCDFGLARPMPSQQALTNSMSTGDMEAEGTKNSPKVQLSGHVVTRWYRAPELILLERNYTNAIDVWSAGCIFGELLEMLKENAPYPTDRAPLFPGKACYPLSPPRTQEKISYKTVNDFPHSSEDQLDRIFQVLGTPDSDDTAFISDQRAHRYIKSFGKRERKPFKTMFKQLTPESEDFLQKTLAFNPYKRISLKQAVEHPLFDQVRDQKLQSLQIEPLGTALDDLSLQKITDMFMDELKYYKQNRENIWGSKTTASNSKTNMEQQ